MSAIGWLGQRGQLFYIMINIMMMMVTIIERPFPGAEGAIYKFKKFKNTVKVKA